MENNYPTITISVKKCPVCGSEHIGVRPWMSGPSKITIDGEEKVTNNVVFDVICDNCKRSWTLDAYMLMKEKEC